MNDFAQDVALSRHFMSQSPRQGGLGAPGGEEGKGIQQWWRGGARGAPVREGGTAGTAGDIVCNSDG